MMINAAVDEVRKLFPIFDGSYDGEYDIYLTYGAFGSFMLDVINISVSDAKQPQNYFYTELIEFYDSAVQAEIEVVTILSFVDELFLRKDKMIADVLNTSIFEALMGSDYSYNLARKYFSMETYNHYLKVTKRVI